MAKFTIKTKSGIKAVVPEDGIKEYNDSKKKKFLYKKDISFDDLLKPVEKKENSEDILKEE